MKFVICLALVCLAQGFPQNSPILNRQGSKIVGGENALPNEFPYQIGLMKYGGLICGGSILNEYHILTAAHCLGSRAFVYSIVAGEYNLDKNDGTEQRVGVSQVFIHEGYGNGVGTNAHDIAILRLASPLKFNIAVQRIALPKAGHISSGEVVVTGWGRLIQVGQVPNILQKLSMPIIHDKDCEGLYERTFRLRVNGEIMICAGFVEGGKASCQGDSGGPLAAKDAGVYLAGVASWSKGCAAPNFPGVYTEVAQYVDWINSIIQ